MRTVLLVDDSPTIRSIVQVYLQGMGCKFLEAADGREALSLVSTGHVDLAIIDLHMPKMDGLEFTRVLRQSGPPQNAVPVCLLTSDKGIDLDQTVKEGGFDAVLIKPISNTALRATVTRLLAQLNG